VEEGTYNLDWKKVEAMISPKTKAMIIPNLIGNLPDWARLRELADKYKLFVLEDSADTLGAQIGGSSSGRFTDMSTTSFYGSHIINCAGNGGMLCVNG
jgi:CDP-6-deoxy-D-xylo-4-hexulose-3-dehydrase